MASHENMNMLSSYVQEDECDRDDSDDHHHQPHPHNLSRLSVCSSSMYTNEDEDEIEGMMMSMTRLSIESFDGDEEFSDEKDGIVDLSSDSDKEPGCYSLPPTPPCRRHRGGSIYRHQGVKEYGSENEAQNGVGKMRRMRRRRRVIRERWAHNISDNKSGYCHSFSGESEGSGVVVITRPKGGRRSLCMDLEEVKACRDLGFELEMPTLDTSSGGNSPIGNWRISSPGDDPRDVKARLKVWAQAVALASVHLTTLPVPPDC